MQSISLIDALFDGILGDCRNVYGKFKRQIDANLDNEAYGLMRFYDTIERLSFDSENEMIDDQMEFFRSEKTKGQSVGLVKSQLEIQRDYLMLQSYRSSLAREYDVAMSLFRKMLVAVVSEWLEGMCKIVENFHRFHSQKKASPLLFETSVEELWKMPCFRHFIQRLDETSEGRTILLFLLSLGTRISVERDVRRGQKLDFWSSEDRTIDFKMLLRRVPFDCCAFFVMAEFFLTEITGTSETSIIIRQEQLLRSRMLNFYSDTQKVDSPRVTL